MKEAHINIIIKEKCEACPLSYVGQYCLKCKATSPWRDIPVTIKDTKAKIDRPHYIPDWCPFVKEAQ